MPPKVESVATLIAKRDITIASLDELLKEFDMLYQVESKLITLENVPAKSPPNAEVLKSSKSQ